MAARQTPRAILVLAALTLGGCKLPSVNLATNEPIKVDIDMRLDVYQHTDGTSAAAPKPSPTPSAGNTQPRSTDPEERRKDRAADIQTFKNSRLVGERHDGLLEVINEPAGEYGDYVRQTVARENTDRRAEMKTAADERKISVEEVQKSQGALWANRSFSGEWIEVAAPDGSWKWEQKKE